MLMIPLKKQSLPRRHWETFSPLCTLPPHNQRGQIKCNTTFRATSCCSPSEGDTSARGCRAALVAGRGSHPRWGQPPRSRCTTPTRRARGGEELCGRWPGGPVRTGGKPPDREAPRPLWRRQWTVTEVSNVMCSFSVWTIYLTIIVAL